MAKHKPDPIEFTPAPELAAAAEPAPPVEEPAAPAPAKKGKKAAPEALAVLEGRHEAILTGELDSAGRLLALDADGHMHALEPDAFESLGAARVRFRKP